MKSCFQCAHLSKIILVSKFHTNWSNNDVIDPCAQIRPRLSITVCSQVEVGLIIAGKWENSKAG